MRRPLHPVKGHAVAGCHVVQHGDGARSFVGLHGWSGSHRSFDPLVARMPIDATLHAFDLPGSGESEPVPGEGCAPMVQRIADAMDALALRDVDLVAACGSGGFALHLAAERPDLVGRLVLVDPFVFVPWYFRIFTVGWVGRFLYACTFANPLGRALTNGALAGRRTGGVHLTEGFAGVDHARNHRQLIAMCRAAETPLPDLARRFRATLDVIYGERTFTAVITSAEIVRSTFPGARVYRVPGSGHLPMHEASDRVADLVFGGARRRGEADDETAPGARGAG